MDTFADVARKRNEKLIKVLDKRMEEELEKLLEQSELDESSENKSKHNSPKKHSKSSRQHSRKTSGEILHQQSPSKVASPSPVNSVP